MGLLMFVGGPGVSRPFSPLEVTLVINRRDRILASGRMKMFLSWLNLGAVRDSDDLLSLRLKELEESPAFDIMAKARLIAVYDSVR